MKAQHAFAQATFPIAGEEIVTLQIGVQKLTRLINARINAQIISLRPARDPRVIAASCFLLVTQTENATMPVAPHRRPIALLLQAMPCAQTILKGRS